MADSSLGRCRRWLKRLPSPGLQRIRQLQPLSFHIDTLLLLPRWSSMDNAVGPGREKKAPLLREGNDNFSHVWRLQLLLRPRPQRPRSTNSVDSQASVRSTDWWWSLCRRHSGFCLSVACRLVTVRRMRLDNVLAGTLMGLLFRGLFSSTALGLFFVLCRSLETSSAEDPRVIL